MNHIIKFEYRGFVGALRQVTHEHRASGWGFCTVSAWNQKYGDDKHLALLYMSKRDPTIALIRFIKHVDSYYEKRMIYTQLPLLPTSETSKGH